MAWECKSLYLDEEIDGNWCQHLVLGFNMNDMFKGGPKKRDEQEGPAMGP